MKKQTEYNDKSGVTTTAVAGRSVSSKLPSRAQVAPREDDDNTRGRKTPQEIAAQRHSDKQHREHIKLSNEEMYDVGKADPGSFERKREKKREQSSKLHGAARDRESEAWGGAELDDDAIYGSAGVGRRGGRGEASYQEAVAREKQYRERKESEKAARQSELLKKEEDRQKKMFEALGLTGIKPGEKIKIAPRQE